MSLAIFLISLCQTISFWNQTSNQKVQWKTKQATKKYNEKPNKQPKSTMKNQTSNQNVQWKTKQATKTYNEKPNKQPKSTMKNQTSNQKVQWKPAQKHACLHIQHLCRTADKCSFSRSQFTRPENLFSEHCWRTCLTAFPKCRSDLTEGPGSSSGFVLISVFACCKMSTSCALSFIPVQH